MQPRHTISSKHGKTSNQSESPSFNTNSFSLFLQNYKNASTQVNTNQDDRFEDKKRKRPVESTDSEQVQKIDFTSSYQANADIPVSVQAKAKRSLTNELSMALQSLSLSSPGQRILKRDRNRNITTSSRSPSSTPFTSPNTSPVKKTQSPRNPVSPNIRRKL